MVLTSRRVKILHLMMHSVVCGECGMRRTRGHEERDLHFPKSELMVVSGCQYAEQIEWRVLSSFNQISARCWLHCASTEKDLIWATKRTGSKSGMWTPGCTISIVSKTHRLNSSHSGVIDLVSVFCQLQIIFVFKTLTHFNFGFFN